MGNQYGQGQPTFPPFKGIVVNTNGVPTNADTGTVSLRIDDPHGATVLTVPEAGLTHVSEGVYTYVWSVPSNAEISEGWEAHWNSTLGGVPLDEAVDTFEITLPAHLVFGALTIMLKPTDYDSVRALLGVTTLDLKDERIELPPFGPHAERMVKDFFGTEYEDLFADPNQNEVLRLAATYATAALMADSFARGGMVGYVPGRQRSVEDWTLLSKELWAYYNTWIAVLAEATTEDVEFVSTGFALSGPTRARESAHLTRKRVWTNWG